MLLVFGIIFTFILFLILLKTSERCSKIWFANLYEIVLYYIAEFFVGNLRKRCLRNIKLEISTDPIRSREGRLRILEIGPAGGRNFAFYPEKSLLICVEPNEYFRSFFNRKKGQFESLHLENFYCTGAEDMNEIKDESVDIVVSTFVLCSVQDMEKSLKEIKRVLVKRGKYYYLEHDRDPNHLIRFFQKLIEPCWSLLTHKCHLTRHIGNSIKKAGFSQVVQNNSRPYFFMFVPQYFIYGIAVK
ncbi:methyltransferase-like protein 7A [Centruroides sculpturatus]|uniref:methyltransferase-like protein 7A n=1 Tax=Centruroides sculpturatus TaxID=218467 RepID=UPI000C6E6BEC|nr:methyltransferase-like protein 7A [Centruroides sculpturatus]